MLNTTFRRGVGRPRRLLREAAAAMRCCTASWLAGITIPPFGIYLRAAAIEDAGVRAHEAIHWEQYTRMGA